MRGGVRGPRGASTRSYVEKPLRIQGNSAHGSPAPVRCRTAVRTSAGIGGVCGRASLASSAALALDLGTKCRLACRRLRIAEEMIVNRSQLVRAVHESTEVTRRTVEDMVEILFGTIISEVRSGRKAVSYTHLR